MTPVGPDVIPLIPCPNHVLALDGADKATGFGIKPRSSHHLLGVCAGNCARDHRHDRPARPCAEAPWPQSRGMNLKDMLGQIEANSRDRRQIGDKLSHGRRSFRGLLNDNQLGTILIESRCRCGRRPHHHVRGFYLSIRNGALSPDINISKPYGTRRRAKSARKSPILGQCDKALKRYRSTQQGECTIQKISFEPDKLRGFISCFLLRS